MTQMKVLIAILLALMIGAACRLLEIPLPAPPTLLGVGLILAITVGYMLTDNLISRRGLASNEVSQTARQQPLK